MTPEMREILAAMAETAIIRSARDGQGNANTLTVIEAAEFAKRANREGREAVYREIGVEGVGDEDVVVILPFATARALIEATTTVEPVYRDFYSNPSLPLAAAQILRASINRLQDARVALSRACEKASDKD